MRFESRPTRRAAALARWSPLVLRLGAGEVLAVDLDGYLAIVNAVPAWTRTRNWTTALLAFKIDFGDRLPE